MLGHQNIIKFLENSFKNNKLSHGYLFYGAKHLGKTTLAKKFINFILCNNRGLHLDDVCGACQHCLELKKETHPDFNYLKKNDDKKNISIEEIRTVLHRLNISSFFNNYKIVLIEEAQDLSQEAANCLLKTLEEPKGKTIIFLVADNLENLPLTVISRLQKLQFFLVPKKEIFEYLLKRGLEREKTKNFSFLAMGRPGIVFNFLEDKTSFENYQKLTKQYLLVFKENLTNRLKIIQEITEINKLLDIWLLLLRDLLLIKNGAGNFIINNFLTEELVELAASYNNQSLNKIIKEIEKSKAILQNNVNPQLVLDNLALIF